MPSDELERHPDFCKNKPIDISDEVWEEHLALVKQITKGIHLALPLSTPHPEVVHDMIQDALTYLLEHPDAKAFYTGARMATKWKRDNYKRGILQTQTFEDLSKVNDAGDVIAFEDNIGEDKAIWEQPSPLLGLDDNRAEVKALLAKLDAMYPQPEGIKDAPVKSGEVPNMYRADAKRSFLELQGSSPNDYALVVAYIKRSYVSGNRFTRAESTAFESAMRRLRKSAQKT